MHGKLISYLRAGYLLHIITVIEILGFSCIFHFCDAGSWMSKEYFSLKWPVMCMAVILPLLAQLDARSRYQNYKLIKDALYLYGFQKRIVKPFTKSRCQRDAIKAAAAELGMSDLCNHHFKSLGYRWYHVLPDVIFEKPLILLTGDFWLTTLFARTYRSRIKYDNPSLLVTTN